MLGKFFGFMKLLSMRLLEFIAFNLSFTLLYPYNEAYINEIGLSPSIIFVPCPLKGYCMIHSCGLVCEKVSIYLLICCLQTCMHGYSVGWKPKLWKDAWSTKSQDSQYLIFLLSVAKRIRKMLAYWLKRQASIARFG